MNCSSIENGNGNANEIYPSVLWFAWPQISDSIRDSYYIELRPPERNCRSRKRGLLSADPKQAVRTPQNLTILAFERRGFVQIGTI
jgi:hypothetical protein